MPLDREQRQILALRHAREVLREIYENAGDAPFWNEGGKGYETVEEIDAALAGALENTLEQMPSPQVLVLFQMSLATAYKTLGELAARKSAPEQGSVKLLDTLLAQTLKLGMSTAMQVEHQPTFQEMLSTMRGIVGIAIEQADAGD